MSDEIRELEELEDRVLSLRSRGDHSQCVEDYYFGSEDRGDNRCDLCRLKDEIRKSRA